MPKRKQKSKDKDNPSTAKEWEVVREEEEVEVLAPEDPVALPLDDEEGHDEDTEKSGLVPYTPLQLYLKEISKFIPLTREEEHEVAVQYLNTKDIEAAKRLIQSNLWLVVKIARDYQKAARNLLDLIQEGNIGLMEAVQNFDPFREVRFPSYASWWIKAYIVRYLIANFRMVKIGTTQAQRKLFFNLNKQKEKLEREGFYPGPKLLAERLDVKESEVIEMEQRLGSPDMSVHTPITEDGDGDLLSVLPSDTLTAEELLSREEISKRLKDNLSNFERTLNDKEKVIFKERLLGEEKVTLQELSDRLSISKERVRQIEERIKQKLKVFLRDEMGDEIHEMG